MSRVDPISAYEAVRSDRVIGSRSYGITEALQGDAMTGTLQGTP